MTALIRYDAAGEQSRPPTVLMKQETFGTKPKQSDCTQSRPAI